MSNSFQFTIASGQVTGEQVVRGSHVETVHIPKDATFTVGTGTVTETLAGSHVTEVTQFTADPLHAGAYLISSETGTVASPTTTDAKGHVHGFSFTIAGGVVTAEQVVEGSSATSTHSHNLPLDPGAQFQVSGATVTETAVRGNEIEVTTFVPSGSAGLYAMSSETTTFIPVGSATTALSVEPHERDEFTFDSAGGVSAIQKVHADGTTSAYVPGSHESFAQAAPGFVVETITHGTATAYEVFHDGNGDGIYTAVAHGTGTLDLAGLKLQLASIEAFV